MFENLKWWVVGVIWTLPVGILYEMAYSSVVDKDPVLNKYVYTIIVWIGQCLGGPLVTTAPTVYKMRTKIYRHWSHNIEC